MKVFDLLLNADDDLDIQGGDLVVGESTRQHQGLILLTNPGEWRGAPQVGVGLQSMLLDDTPTAAIVGEIQAQLESDGLQVEHINLASGGAIDLAAHYRDIND
jgi:hypothetical protein